MCLHLSANPNYFGKALINIGYAIWSRSVMVFAIFLVIWAIVFAPNMKKTDQSMSRYPDFAAWKEIAGSFFPGRSSAISNFVFVTLNDPNDNKVE